VAALLLLICAPGVSSAQPRSIDQSVSESHLVAIGRLKAYVEDTGAREARARAIEDADKGTGKLNFTELTAKQLPGTYTFSILARLKGEATEELRFHHPQPVTWLAYSDDKFTVKDGGIYLLFLAQQGGEWRSVDQSHPFIPLGEKLQIQSLPLEGEDKEISAALIRLMIASLDDEAVRRSSLNLLRGTRSADVVSAARRFWDDPDYFVQTGALNCLATNQVVEAIPRIIELKRKIDQAGTGDLGRIPRLDVYNTPECLPQLNVLLFDPAPMVREHVMLALRNNRLADQGSIPYLMVALKDPNTIVAAAAGATLHELIPSLGAWRGPEAFLTHREEEIQKLDEWWVDHLSGRHGDGPPLVRPRSGAPAAAPSTRPGSGRGPAD
jgi:hypothetical protein